MFDFGSFGHFDYDLSEVVGTLELAGLCEAIEFLTFSIKSGFFPEDLRGLAGELGRRLGRPLEVISGPPVHANESLALLSQKQLLDQTRIDAFWTSELSALGSPGQAMRAVLEARAGDLDTAMRSYASARVAGDRVTWAAYTIGIRALERQDYRQAAPWFGAASHELLGTLQAYALLMHSLCLYRLDRLKEALERTYACMGIPMRAEGYRLGAWICAGSDRATAPGTCVLSTTAYSGKVDDGLLSEGNREA